MHKPELDTQTAFALYIEAASKQFDILQKILAGAIEVVVGVCDGEQSHYGNTERRNVRALVVIEMALAKEFVFNAVRAYRICRDDNAFLTLPRHQRKAFINLLGPLVRVRDVNEHGYEQSAKSRPMLHEVLDTRMVLDETSLCYSGPQQLFMGPINLFDVYRQVEGMRSVAGFSILCPNGLNS